MEIRSSHLKSAWLILCRRDGMIQFLKDASIELRFCEAGVQNVCQSFVSPCPSLVKAGYRGYPMLTSSLRDMTLAKETPIIR